MANIIGSPVFMQFKVIRKVTPEAPLEPGANTIMIGEREDPGENGQYVIELEGIVNLQELVQATVKEALKARGVDIDDKRVIVP